MDSSSLEALEPGSMTGGIKFLFSQVTELLTWNMRKRATEPPPSAPVGAAEALDDELHRHSVDPAVLDRYADQLRVLRSQLADYAIGVEVIDPRDSTTLERVAALRGLLEIIFEQRITFKGERRPSTGSVLASGAGAVAVGGSNFAPIYTGPVTQVFNMARDPVLWPHQVGRIPPKEREYQIREAQKTLPQQLTHGRTAVLAGLGGTGKTMLAAAHARQLWEAGELDLLVWITATDREAILKGYANAGWDVTDPRPRQPVDELAERFLTWLANTERRWLVVLDDLADPLHLQRLWPAGPTGRVLVTTRRHDEVLAGSGSEFVDIGLFTDQEAADYLAARLRPEQLIGADSLVKALGRLPLALAQAASFIVERRLDCARYQRRFEKQPLEINVPRTAPAGDYEKTVATTWSVSIDAADGLPPEGLARPVLALSAMLDPNGIPARLFTTAAVRDYLVGNHGDNEARQVLDALHNLRRLSLVTLSAGETEDSVLRVHELVQRVVREATESSYLEGAARALADGISSLWIASQDDRDFFQLLQNNAVALSGAEHGPLQTPALHELMFLLGDSYGQAGLVDKAHKYFEGLLEQASIVGEAESDDILRAREREAYWLGYSGDAEDAFLKYKELAAELTRALGPDRKRTLIARHNAARFRGRSDDVQGAVADLKRLISDEDRALGPTHIETLKSRNILGYWLNMAGDHAGAIAELQNVLPVLIEHHGPDHGETLRARNDLAMAKADSGDCASAIAEGEKLVLDRTRLLGADRPETLSSRAYVAQWRTMMGEDSRASLEAIVADHVDVLGHRHPNTLRARTYYIEAIAAGGDVTRAIGMMTGHLKIVLEVHKEKHILTKRCQQKLDDWQGKA